MFRSAVCRSRLVGRPVRRLLSSDSLTMEELAHMEAMAEAVISPGTIIERPKKQDESSPTKKKKPRHKKTKVQKAAPTNNSTTQQQQSAAPGKKKTRQLNYQKRQASSCMERVWLTAQSTAYTGSVQILPNNSNSNNSNDSNKTLETPHHLKVITTTATTTTITTTTKTDDHQTTDNDDTTNIIVQPLLILDLNGILCHRIRKKENEIQIPYDCFRTFSGGVDNAPPAKIAHTYLVERPNLHEFLQLLDQNFCLGIWTSAKQKTANQLIQQLMPSDIRNRLLFVHAQQHCKIQNPGARAQDVIFEKDLKQIWDRYPIFNASNTLLVDDSPDKCVEVQNAIHPPPLHGRKILQLPHEGQPIVSDEQNVESQHVFFESLVDFWKQHSTIHYWDAESDDGVLHHSEILFDFLQRHGAKMGYQP